MIGSFVDAALKTILNGERSNRYPADIQNTVHRKLVDLDVSVALQDLRTPPGNRLEKLTGNREGQYSIRVNDKWRLCVDWDIDHPENVELIDYH
jgi:proteic killer suppression protein